MRLHIGFAALVIAMVAVTAWVFWDDAFPSWRRYQRELVTRERTRLETELADARRALDQPEVKYELAELDRRIAALDEGDAAPTARLAEVQGRLGRVRGRIDSLRVRLHEANRELQAPQGTERRRAIEIALEGVQHDYARATGTWPPDTARVRALWVRRDSLSRVLISIEGPIEALRESLNVRQGEASELEIEAISLTSVRDSLEQVRAKILEPVHVREEAIARLASWRVGVREIVSPDGKEVARCPTCHGTMSDPPGVHPQLPSMEVFRDVPCTICHQGHGRALTVAEAHEGVLAASGAGAGRYSLRARIDALLSGAPADRERTREELRRITGIDPAEDGVSPGIEDPDSAAAVAWSEWWKRAEPYFEPNDVDRVSGESDPLLAAGIDPWIFSTRGRPLRYIGSQKCLRCHEVRHREHVGRWLATKARSLERLADERDPSRCLPCHSTGYDPATNTYAEPGVTCEGCHGPGERYGEMMIVGQELLDRGDTMRGSAIIDMSARLAREAVSRRLVAGETGEVNVCVTCHNPRRHRDGGPSFMERQTLPMRPAAGSAASNVGERP